MSQSGSSSRIGTSKSTTERLSSSSIENLDNGSRTYRVDNGRQMEYNEQDAMIVRSMSGLSKLQEPASGKLYISMECYKIMKCHWAKELKNVGQLYSVRVYEEQLDYSDVFMIEIVPKSRITTAEHDIRTAVSQYKEMIKNALDIMNRERGGLVTEALLEENETKTRQKNGELDQTSLDMQSTRPLNGHGHTSSKQSSDDDNSHSSEDFANKNVSGNTSRRAILSANGREMNKGSTDITGNMEDLGLSRNYDELYSSLAGQDNSRKERPTSHVTKNVSRNYDENSSLASQNKSRKEIPTSHVTKNSSVVKDLLEESDIGMQWALEKQQEDMIKDVEPPRREISPRSIELYYEQNESKDGKLSFTTPNGISVMIYQGNIVDQGTTAIVNASNEGLWFGEGVSGAIKLAAGWQIQDFCQEYVRVNGLIPVGDVALTRACGKLKCVYVIHAVGPERDNFPDDKEVHQKLKSAILNSLLCLEKELSSNPPVGPGSISIPAISAGIYGVEMPLVTRAFRKAIFEFDANRSKKYVKEIHLVNIDRYTTDVFQSYFRKLITKYTQTKSHEPEIKDEKSLSKYEMQHLQDSKLRGATEMGENTKYTQSKSLEPEFKDDSSFRKYEMQDRPDLRLRGATGMGEVNLEKFDRKGESSFRDVGVSHSLGKHELDSEFKGNGCVVCKNDHVDPRELPCKHRICILCELRYKDTIGTVCPKCMKPYEKTQVNQPTEDYLYNLETNRKQPSNLGIENSLRQPKTYGQFLDTGCVMCKNKKKALKELPCKHHTCMECVDICKNHFESRCPKCTQPFEEVQGNQSPVDYSAGDACNSLPDFNTRYGDSSKERLLETSSRLSHGVRDHSQLHRTKSSPDRYDPSRYDPARDAVRRLGKADNDSRSNYRSTSIQGKERGSTLGDLDTQHLSHSRRGQSSNQNSQKMFDALTWSNETSSSAATSRDLSQGDPKPASPSSDKDDDCCICMDTIKIPKVLPCKHRFCKDCIDQHEKITGPKCPQCFVPFGKIRGNQPPGSCNITRQHNSLSGYEGFGTIQIDYDIPSSIQTERHPHPGNIFYGTRRTAYLPDNEEGNDIAKLLKKAFDEGHIFTVGKSVTSGIDDSVVWNDIHHKTDMYGAPYGYPDPSYLKRVREELRAKGITSERGDRKYAKK